jgi:predicted esterase
MTLTTAPDEDHAKQDIWSACDPVVGPSDPAVMQRECHMPALPELFIGLGDVAPTMSEVLQGWNQETWEMWLDDQPIDLAAFGTLDVDYQAFKGRLWNVMLLDATPGVHTLRYTIAGMAGSAGPIETTWLLTIEGSQASPTAAGSEGQRYPPLGAEAAPGQHAYSSAAAQLDFLLYVPGAYGAGPAARWPLILFLHGSGKVGSVLDALRTGPLPSLLEGQADFPFLVVSPQLRGEPGWEFWPQEAPTASLLTLLDEIQSAYSVDPDRVYLTGVSLGANGVWEIGLRHRQRFAALVPVMGYYGFPFTVPDNICELRDMPIWAFHGAKDDIVPLDAEAGLVDALQACGGKAQFTVYPDGRHDVDGQAYATDALYSWLLEQKLDRPAGE